MGVQTAKYWAEVFSNMNPDEVVWVLYTDKSDLSDEVDTFACETIEVDEEGKSLIEFDVDKDFTDDLFRTITEQVNGDDHLWETYNTVIDDCMRAVIGDYIQEKSKATDDKELWEA